MKQVTKGQWGGYDTYILHSRELEVTLLPRLGNNVISLWDRKEERQILRTPDESDLAYYMQKPYHFGIPLLVPRGAYARGNSGSRAPATSSSRTRQEITTSTACTGPSPGASVISRKMRTAVL